MPTNVASPHTPPKILTYNPQPRAPQSRLAVGSCDAHCHVFGPADRFPFSRERRFTPVDASKEQLFALHRHLGITRCVIVQSVMHGHDNRVVEDAIAAGGGHYLGVALVPTDVPQSELARLAAAGFRGVRFNFMPHLLQAGGIDGVIALTHHLAPLNMHLQVHFESSLIHTLAPALAQSAVPVVIDHFGRVDAALGPDHADFRALMALMRNPLFRVKLSGVDRACLAWPYTDAVALTRALLEAYGDRCLWGTDWPHPNHHHVPDDGQLVDAIDAIAPTPALRQLLMIDNPATFYRFTL